MVHLYIYNREIAKILLLFRLNNVIQANIFSFLYKRVPNMFLLICDCRVFLHIYNYLELLFCLSKYKRKT